jgi:hypothetical protein
MKTILIFLSSLTFVFCAASPCFAADEQSNGPVLTFEDADFDFGEVAEGSSVTHEYTFTNTGKSLLEIEEVKPTCGCTVAGDFTKKAEPGKKGTISVTFRTQGYDGHVKKSIIVRSNVADKPEIFLTLEGDVKSVISVSPKSISLGQVDDTTTAPISGSFTITNSSKTPLTILDLVTQGPLVKAGLTKIRDGFEYKVTVTVSPPFKERQNMEWITVKTDSKKMPSINVSYSYYATPASRVNPIAIMLSNDDLARGTDREITMECRPGFSMSIADIKSSDPKITFKLKETKKGRSFKLTVHIPAGYRLDDANMPTISFKLENVPNEPSYSVPIYRM